MNPLIAHGKTAIKNRRIRECLMLILRHLSRPWSKPLLARERLESDLHFRIAHLIFSWFVFFLMIVFSAKIENAIVRAMRVWCAPLKNADMSAFWGLLTMAQSLSFFLHLMDWACSSKMPVLCSCVTCIGIHNSSHCQHRIMLRCFARFVVFLNRTKSLSRLFWLQNWHGMTPVVVCVFWEGRDELSSVSWVFCLCWDEMQ